MIRSGSAIGELERIARGVEARSQRGLAAAEVIRRAGGHRWVGLYDVEDKEIAALAWTGTESPAHPRFPVTQGLNGEAVRTGQVVNAGDVATDARYLTTLDTTRSEIVVPVRDSYDGRIVGTIDVESDRLYAFGPEEVAFLEACADALKPLWK